MSTNNRNSCRTNILALSIAAALGIGTASAATFPVTTNADAGPGSLRDAINSANGAAGEDIIDMSAISGQTISLASSLPQITDTLELQGANVTVDGGGSSAILYAYGGTFYGLVASDMTITGGVGTYYGGYYNGGGIYVVGDLTLDNVTVTGNSADTGGGILAGSIIMSNSTVTANSATGNGGGILAPLNILMTSSVVSNNNATVGGGMLIGGQTGSSFTISDSTISDNTASAYNGGVSAYAKYYDSSIVVENTTISGNSAPVFGGIEVANKYSGSFSQFNNSTVTGNSASDTGAGVIVTNLYYDTGKAGYDGDGLVGFSNSTITNNSAANAGGGLLASNPGSTGGVTLDINLDNTVIQGNSAGSGNPDIQEGSAAPPPTIIQKRLNRANLVLGSLSPRLLSNFSETPEELIARLEAAATNATSGGGNQITVTSDFSLIGSAPTSVTFVPDAATTALLGSDPALGPLADNGGPTLTRLPGAGSALIDAIPNGSNNCGIDPLVDQRGFPRPSEAGAACDIGAVEVGNVLPAPPAIPTLSTVGLALLAGIMGLVGWLGFRRRAG